MKKSQLAGMVGATAAAVTAAVVVRRLHGPARRPQLNESLRAVPAFYLTEEHYLMPTESIRKVLKPYSTRIPVRA